MKAEIRNPKSERPSPRPSPIGWEREKEPTRLAEATVDVVTEGLLRLPSPLGGERARVRGNQTAASAPWRTIAFVSCLLNSLRISDLTMS